MLGAIAGDIIGSVYEHDPIKTTEFPLFDHYSRFTDDTVLTIAVAYAILEKMDYTTSLKYFGRKYPDAGYGMFFYRWMFASRSEPYNSWGNGSAMRVSPVGFAFDSIEQVLNEAERSAVVTHSHAEGIMGAQATALAVFLARTGSSKHEIKQEISTRFCYDLDQTLDVIRPYYSFDVSCQGTVPEAIIAFLESTDFEDAVRKAISLGGDSDTLACITGGIAQAFYKSIPQTIVTEVNKRLPFEFVSIIDKFNDVYGCEI
jgi:ADP-ribosylglycohydrolase